MLNNSLMGVKARSGWLIVVSGHTDNTGNPKLNQMLSLRRAEAVRDWMRDTGDVPESCFAVQGYGESRPIATNDTPDGRALNRRVEISLVPQANACQIPGHPRLHRWMMVHHNTMESNSMAIPVYLWLKDDGGVDIKGSVDIQDREGSIEVVAQEHNLCIPTNNNTGKLENVEVVKVNPEMYDIKDPSKEKHNYLERIELRYEKITWIYKDSTIIHSDSWNERATA
jgi:hypothetical protein